MVSEGKEEAEKNQRALSLGGVSGVVLARIMGGQLEGPGLCWYNSPQSYKNKWRKGRPTLTFQAQYGGPNLNCYLAIKFHQTAFLSNTLGRQSDDSRKHGVSGEGRLQKEMIPGPLPGHSLSET